MFYQYVRRCLTSQYADFRGRASRMEYICLVSLHFMLMAFFSGLSYFLSAAIWWAGIVTLVVFVVGKWLIDLVLFIPICAVHVRRMHDTGRSAAPLAVLLGLFLIANTIACSNMLDMERFSDPVAGIMALENVSGLFFSFLGGPYTPVGVLQRLIMGLIVTPSTEWSLIMFMPLVVLILLLTPLAWLMLRHGTDKDNRYGPAPEPFRDPGRGLVSAVLQCLVHGYTRFAGRATRSEYWWFTLASTALVSSFSVPWYNVLSAYSSIYDISTLRIVLFSFFALLPQLALFLPNLAVLVRRLHDRDKSGLWLVGLLCVQVVAVFFGFLCMHKAYGSLGSVLFFLLCALGPSCLLLWQMIRPGSRGPNRYGPNPRAGYTL